MRALKKIFASYKHVLAAFLLTLGMFTLLPFIEILSDPDMENIELRDINTLEITVPLPEEVIRHEPELNEQTTELTPEQPPRPLFEPEQIALDFQPELGALSGDFAVNPGMFDFAVQGVADVFELFDLDEAPVPLSQIPPTYPPGARGKRIEGMARVTFIVNTDGTIESPAVIEAEPTGIFERAALSAVRKWRFKPGVKDDAPVRTRVQQTFRFILDE